jgi:hypothetical protein
MMYTDHMYIRYNNNEHHTDYYVLILILKKVSHIRSLSSIGLSVPHRKHITSPLRAQQVNANYRFVTMLY